MSDEVRGDQSDSSGRAARGRPRNELSSELDPERRAFANLMRTEFFDRMKASGWDYARIGRRLGSGFSGTTLSRMANGRTVPNRVKLTAILSLVEEIAEQPLTEDVRCHVYEVYMRALAAAKPELHHVYVVEDETRRLLLEVERQSRLGQAGSAAESDAPEDHPALEPSVVRLRDEVLQHVQQVAQTQIPLITQPPQRLESPSDSAPSSATLLEIRQVLGLVGESVIRHIAVLEEAEEEGTPETTPLEAVPGAETAPPMSTSGLGQKPPRSTARPAAITAVTAVLVVVVLLLGVLLDHALRPDTVSAGPSAGATEPASPGTTKARPRETSGSPRDAGVEEGAVPRPSQRTTAPSSGDAPSTGARDGEESQGSGETPDRAIGQDGGSSEREADPENQAPVSPATTAGTETSPRDNWTLTIRIYADSDGEVQVAHNDGQQAACGKTINEPAKECRYIIRHNNFVTLDPVDFVQSWGSGICQGADRYGGCGFLMTSDTELDLHVLRGQD
ncbi:hypothetical protein ACIQ6Y_32965 [Streptomyces sp. NPDC096205]|uniref:hypothetical protein n=1 Tax=Streptomyces sp. NPDC096205 TaxID=3366081 RepID=UPI00382F1476